MIYIAMSIMVMVVGYDLHYFAEVMYQRTILSYSYPNYRNNPAVVAFWASLNKEK